MFKKLLLVITIGVISSPSIATETPVNKNWNANIDAGYVGTTGNSETTTFRAKAHFDYSHSLVRHAIDLSGLNTAESGTRSAEKYTAAYQADFDLGERQGLFGRASYEDDRFSGFEYDTSLSAGYFYRLLNDDTHYFQVEVGPGYRWQETDDGDSLNAAILRLFGEYRWQITDTARFTQTLSGELGKDNDVYQSLSELATTISDRLELKLSYDYKYSTFVPIGVDDVDTITSVGISYIF